MCSQQPLLKGEEDVSLIAGEYFKLASFEKTADIGEALETNQLPFCERHKGNLLDYPHNCFPPTLSFVFSWKFKGWLRLFGELLSFTCVSHMHVGCIGVIKLLFSPVNLFIMGCGPQPRP